MDYLVCSFSGCVSVVSWTGGSSLDLALMAARAVLFLILASFSRSACLLDLTAVWSTSMSRICIAKRLMP